VGNPKIKIVKTIRAELPFPNTVPRKAEKPKILCHEIEPNASKDRAMNEVGR
jgi:hypothetical protein